MGFESWGISQTLNKKKTFDSKCQVVFEIFILCPFLINNSSLLMSFSQRKTFEEHKSLKFSELLKLFAKLHWKKLQFLPGEMSDNASARCTFYIQISCGDACVSASFVVSSPPEDQEKFCCSPIQLELCCSYSDCRHTQQRHERHCGCCHADCCENTRVFRERAQTQKQSRRGTSNNISKFYFVVKLYGQQQQVPGSTALRKAGVLSTLGTE